MKPGARPKPTKQKQLEGNPGRRPLPENEAKPTPGAPVVPEWLSDLGRKVWDTEAPELAKIGLLTQADGIAFGLFCESMANYITDAKELRGEKRVAVSEKGSAYQHPLVGMCNKSWDQILKMCREFGVTPASRSQVTAVDVPKEADGKDRYFAGPKLHKAGA